jgi:phage recombination protein Bet
MTTDLTVHGTPQTALTIADDQATFTDQQVAALRHMGVDGASPADLAVFFHVVKRTGLDPFARQIYMISRKSKGETKQTIQTGIDGYRLIGRRAADARHESISVSAPEWARADGQWMPVWSAEWGTPLAARVTITRGGEPFTAVALFDEYKQTKYDGNLTAMWAQRPAGQIAKCAEALVWRMAFPQDLAGVYVEDELQHADGGPAPRPTRESAADVLATPAVVVEHTETDADRARANLREWCGENGIDLRTVAARFEGEHGVPLKDTTDAVAIDDLHGALAAELTALNVEPTGDKA